MCQQWSLGLHAFAPRFRTCFPLCLSLTHHVSPALAAAQARIASTVDEFYGDASDAAMAANAYKRAVEELDAKTARELDAPYRATVLEPIGKLASFFPEINRNIEKRNKKVRPAEQEKQRGRGGDAHGS
jgi:hypothetical protein